MPKTTVTMFAAAVLLLTGCSAGSPQEPTRGPSATTSVSPTPTSASATPDPTQPVSADGIYLQPEAEYVDFRPGRDLSTLEKALMRRPGRYAGSAFDLDTVVAKVTAAQPRTSRAWAEEILTQIHPDYADAAQDIISFKARIEEIPDEPVERMGSVDVVGQNHFAIVLDASGSMAARTSRGTRMSEAKAAIRSFVRRLPAGSTASLRVYGQRGSNATADKKVSCRSTEVLHTGRPRELVATLDDVSPTGWTPLARAVRRSVDDIPESASDAIVYVVTDGLETCGGDPVAATKALATRGVRPVVNVIGFHLGNESTRQLRAMARAGGGRFTAADSQAALEDYWSADARRMMEAWTTWKQEALTTIEAQGRANMDRAEQSGRAVMDKVDVEWDQAKQVIAALEERGRLDSVTRTPVWRDFYLRKNTIWGWAYQHKNENWSKAYTQKVNDWQAAYSMGTGQWSRYYRRSVRG